MAVVYGNLSSIKSEQKVLKHLEKNLNEEWIIYQNFLLDKNVDDGQVDFLILHKTIGGIILEVKGGRIETYLDPNNEYKWLSIDRKNEKFSIKDPFLQSKDQAWKLKRYLKDIKTMMHSFNFVNAAAFPDVQKIDFESPFMNDLNTFSREDFNNNLGFQFKKLLQNVQQRPHTEQTLQQLHNYLLPIFKTNSTLQSSFDFMDEQFNEATEEQFKAMIEIEENSKLYVKGPAGTGKTLIAINFAKRMLENNKTVFFACYTQNLGEYLKSEFSQYENIFTGNIHSLLREIFSLVGGKMPFDNEDKKKKFSEYTNDMNSWINDNGTDTFIFEAQNLYRLFEILDIKINTVLIDECQDFSLEAQEGISLLNLYSDEPKFYMFGDPNQTQLSEWKPLFTEPTRTLSKNMRNSNEINEFINKLFALDVENSGISDDLNVDYEVLSGFELNNQKIEIQEKLPKILHNLTTEGVELSQIAILGLHTGHANDIRHLSALGKKIYELDEITVDSALRYKGLEKDVVIAIFPDYNVSNTQLLKSQIYTGITRPQKKLILLIGNKNQEILSNQ